MCRCYTSCDRLLLFSITVKMKPCQLTVSHVPLCCGSAQSLSVVRELQDVAVTAPTEACFECEVSADVIRTPEWSMNGELLQSSSRVRVEKMGTVHRLILRQTSADMSGVVEFTCGKAKSKARLQVLSK